MCPKFGQMSEVESNLVSENRTPVRRSYGFQPGVSGNPGGRPAGIEGMRDLCKAKTAEAIATLAAIMADGAAPPAARTQAAMALLDRAWGRPAQPVSDADGGKLAPALYTVIIT